MVLIVDEEVQGYRETFSNVDSLKGSVLECIDGSVETITIKKRAVNNNSQLRKIMTGGKNESVN